MQSSARNVTLLRIAAAFAVGILIAELTDANEIHWPSFLTLSLAALLLAIAAFLGFTAHRVRVSSISASGISLFCAIVALGCWATQLHSSSVRTEWPAEPVDCKVCVESFPVARSHTTRYEANIAGHKVYMYVSGEESTSFSPGDSLMLHAVTIRTPENFSENLTFDYARFLLHKGISGTVFVKAEKIECLSSNRNAGLFARWQSYLAEKYAQDPLLGEKEQGVIRALTLGDRSILSDELRDVYATAGVSHILALSGLHVGIIYMLLSFCFRPLFSGRRRRWIGELLSLSALWVFALLTGLSPSIQRAVLMCTIYSMASLVSSDRSPISSLSLAALVMICCNPFTLFDVGFELSFASMLSILCLVPDLDEKLPDGRKKRGRTIRRIGRYVAGILLVSLVAQAGTLPLTLHYFNRFPTFFLLSNLVVMPAVTVTMFVAVFWWICSFLPFAWALPGRLLNGCVHVMNHSVTAVAAIPGSTIAVNDFGWPEVILSYLALLFFVQFCHKKTKALVWSLAFVAAFLAVRLLR